jgi:hypothetical protein
MDDHERRTPAAEHDAEGTPRPFARVNIYPDDAPDEPGPAAGQLASATGAEDVRGVWSPPALGLGVLALIIIVVTLILILQGVFRMMPN